MITMFNRFIEFIKSCLVGALYENGELSLTRVIALSGFVLFALGSLYLLINNIDWSGYSTFAGYTGGGGAALQFGNKFINSKYNSAPGSYSSNNSSSSEPPMRR